MRIYYFAICEECGEVHRIREDYLKHKKTPYCNSCRILIDAKTLYLRRDPNYNEKSIQTKQKLYIPKNSLYYGLYNMGYDDAEISEILGIKRKNICSWRHDKGLPPNYKCMDMFRDEKGRFKKGMMSGKNNPTYIEDRELLKTPTNHRIRELPKYHKWRNSIYKRDRYTCQICGEKHRKGFRPNLYIHHIKSLSNIINDNSINNIDDAFDCEELWDKNNGIVLCENCHKWVHRINPLDFQ